MDNTCTVSIADITLKIHDDAPRIPEWLAEGCKAYHAAGPSSPQTTVVIRRRPGLAPALDERLIDLGGEAGGFALRGADFTASRRRCGLPIEVEAHPEAGMAGILRWIVGVLLIERGGLLLHSMSFSHLGGGIACAGPSGCGKSTLSRLLAPSVRLFTDECTAVRFLGEAPMVCATPFAGELGIISGPAEAPLEALFFLRHSAEMEARRLGVAEATARLLGCAFAPLRGGVWMQACLAGAERLARAVPCFDLGFRPQPGVWEVIQDASHWTVPSA